jgi:uncharacterized protein YbbK (DUF523 family)
MPRPTPRKTKQSRPHIGVSSCLLGERVRYDGGHKRNPWIVRMLARHFELVPICPEVAIGLGVPRPPIRLVQRGDGVRALGVHGNGPDVTAKLNRCGNSIARQHADLCGYIFKTRSPSCGMAGVPLHDTTGHVVGNATGIYAAAFMRGQPLLPVEDEEGLADPARRRDFVARVRAYASRRTTPPVKTRERLQPRSNRPRTVRPASRMQVGRKADEDR